MADSDAWRLLRAYVTPVTPETPPAATDDPAAEAGEADDGGAAPTPPPSSATPDEPETPPTPAETLRARIAGVRNVGAALDAALPVGLVQGAARVPTPGGLFPLFVALFFFLFAIVPVHPSGATRLNLIWRALTGGASLPPSPPRLRRGQRRSPFARFRPRSPPAPTRSARSLPYGSWPTATYS